MHKRFLSFLLLAAATLLAAFSHSYAQSRPDFNRPSSIDVQNYTMRVSFDRAKKRVLGDTTVTFAPTKSDFRTLELDSVGLAFTSIKLDPSGTLLRHRNAGGKVIVTLDRAYKIGEPVAVRFAYSAKPKKGIYFVAANNDPEGRPHSAQIWTQGEPDEARHWFPSFDFPSDKATTEQFITADAGETVIGNGELVEKIGSADAKTTTWHYKMTVPHATYLVSFIIGKFARIDEKYKSIPITYYTYPGTENLARLAYSDTARMMDIFEKLTGVAFPFNKYDQTVVANFKFGGMENITATTMAGDEIFQAETPEGKRNATDLVSHELAHSWFGNLVTCRNWAELWLNEGFASYMEAVFLEQSEGREAYNQKIMTDAISFVLHDAVTDRRHGLFNKRAAEIDKLFDTSPITYEKGSVVLHMLREEVGTDVFWRAVNKYLTKHKFGSVETTDLLAAMELESGKDLDWFFDQWVYGGGAPRLEITSQFKARTSTLTVQVKQTQAADSLVPNAFRLPLTFIAINENGKQSLEATMLKRNETFTFKLNQKPTSLDVPPLEDSLEDRIPAKFVKITPLTFE